MLLIRCPYCDERRPEIEFGYAGEAHIARPLKPDEMNDADWETFLFQRTNTRGRHFERWRHVHGCGRFFNAVRDTVTDRFERTYPAGEEHPGEADRWTGESSTLS